MHEEAQGSGESAGGAGDGHRVSPGRGGTARGQREHTGVCCGVGAPRLGQNAGQAGRGQIDVAGESPLAVHRDGKCLGAALEDDGMIARYTQREARHIDCQGDGRGRSEAAGGAGDGHIEGPRGVDGAAHG